MADSYQCVAVALHGTDWLDYPYCMATVQTVDYVAQTVTIEWWERVASKTAMKQWNKQVGRHTGQTPADCSESVDYSKCMHHPHRLPLDAITSDWVYVHFN
jgi:hypothetical protein